MLLDQGLIRQTWVGGGQLNDALNYHTAADSSGVSGFVHGAFILHPAGVIGPLALRITVQSLSQAAFAFVQNQRWMYGVLVARCVARPGALASPWSLAALARPGGGLKVKRVWIAMATCRMCADGMLRGHGRSPLLRDREPRAVPGRSRRQRDRGAAR